MSEQLQLLTDDECAICYDAISRHDVLEPCGHKIHSTCFLMSHSELCPICRQVVENPLYIPNELPYVNPPPFYITWVVIFIVIFYLFLFFIHHHIKYL